MSRLAVFAAMVALALSSASLTSCKKAGDEEKIKELTDRVVKLEAEAAKFREVEGFVRPVMDQQKAEADRRAAMEPDPDARFAVNIDGSPFIGPEGAAVTVIEAFDFA